jgi:hypothetical protein
VIQYWIERLGADPTIPDLQTAREGSRYAHGGFTLGAIKAGERRPLGRTVSTGGYPAGPYRFYIEFKEQDKVLETLTVDFEIRP